VATISKMLKNIGLFCKRDLQKRPIFCRVVPIFSRVVPICCRVVPICSRVVPMGWLRLVGCLKIYVSFAKELYKRDLYSAKRPVFLSILLIVATPYLLWRRPFWLCERWGAGVETQKYVRGDIGGWGRVPFNETYAPSLSTIYDGA